MEKRPALLSEAIAFAIGKTVHSEWGYMTPGWGKVTEMHEVVGRHPDDFSVVRFTDGTAIAVITNHAGPYSEVTPDVDITTEVYVVEGWSA